MDAARIAELLEPFLQSPAGPILKPCHSEERSDEACPKRGRREPAVLHASQLHSISIYIDLFLRWNARVNLSAVRDPEQIVTRHFGESLFAARHLFPRAIHAATADVGCPAERSSAGATSGAAPAMHEGGRAALQGRVGRQKENWALAPESDSSDQRPKVSLADLGSGAGFPGIPIKLWAPRISVALIESNHKKAAFLREVTRALTLTDVNILTARAESLTRVAFDVVTLRAVDRFEAILPVAARLIAPGGRLALLIGSAQFDAARSALAGLVWAEPEPVPLSRSRILAIAQRSETTG